MEILFVCLLSTVLTGTVLADKSVNKVVADQLYARIFSNKLMPTADTLDTLRLVKEIYSELPNEELDRDIEVRRDRAQALLEACKGGDKANVCRAEYFANLVRLSKRESNSNTRNLLVQCKNAQFDKCIYDVTARMSQVAKTIDQEKLAHFTQLMKHINQTEPLERNYDLVIEDEEIVGALVAYFKHEGKFGKTISKEKFQQRVESGLLPACRTVSLLLGPFDGEVASIRKYKRSIKLDKSTINRVIGIRVCLKILDRSNDILSKAYIKLRENFGSRKLFNNLLNIVRMKIRSTGHW